MSDVSTPALADANILNCLTYTLLCHCSSLSNTQLLDSADSERARPAKSRKSYCNGSVCLCVCVAVSVSVYTHRFTTSMSATNYTITFLQNSWRYEQSDYHTPDACSIVFHVTFFSENDAVCSTSASALFGQWRQLA